LEPRLHPIADTSLRAYERVCLTLSARERAVLLSLCDAGVALTGGELAERMGLDRTSIRPRLTALCDAGVIRKLPARVSRAKGESVAHPYEAVVTRAAVERGDH
jgi:predicted transcriptional regulator